MGRKPSWSLTGDRLSTFFKLAPIRKGLPRGPRNILKSQDSSTGNSAVTQTVTESTMWTLSRAAAVGHFTESDPQTARRAGRHRASNFEAQRRCAVAKKALSLRNKGQHVRWRVKWRDFVPTNRFAVPARLEALLSVPSVTWEVSLGDAVCAAAWRGGLVRSTSLREKSCPIETCSSARPTSPLTT